MDEITLKKLQNLELHLLIEFDKICRKENLTYFLDSGSALGAVRHGGFIPWDDDIDVGMPRKDYERFMEVGQQLLPDSIFLQNRNTEESYQRAASKLRLVDTYFPETEDFSYKHNGIFIDIFPFDYLPNNRKLAKLNISYVIELFHIIRTQRGSKKSLSKSSIRRVLSRLIKWIPSSWVDSLEKYSMNYARKRENEPSDLITCYFWRMSLTKQYLFSTNRMFPVKDIDFEGHKFKIVNDPDYYLRMMYGDYMKLPPLEKRVVHCKGIIDFGNY